jgi:hypothetical protein
MPTGVWRDMPDVWERIRNKEVRVYARWTVRLDCGHLTTTLTEPDWKPGSEPQANVERAEELRAEIETSDVFAGDGRDHWLRMIDLGLPQPEPEVRCSDCEGAHAIIAYERVGWLVPPPKPPTARKAKPRTPTREELLELRIKELESENARLKAGQADG